jgi:hypothetical protein
MVSLLFGFLAPIVLSAPAVAPGYHRVPARPAVHINQANWQRMPYSGGLLYATAVRNGWIRPRPSPRTLLETDLKCRKPLKCTFKPRDASVGPEPVNETPVAISVTKKIPLISGANDFNCPSILGFYVTNRGAQWDRSCATLVNGSGNGDPIVGVDLNGTAYRGGLDAFSDGSSGIILSHSTDRAAWSNPVVAATNLYSGGLIDKPWLQIDTNPRSPRRNTLYISATQFDAANDTEITVSHSTDGGSTWTTVPIGEFMSYPTVNQFSDLAIAPDGTVYVTWMRCATNPSTGTCGGTLALLLIAKSTDGGNTWSGASTIASVRLAPSTCGAFYGCLPNTNERLSDIPATAVDNSGLANTGTLYAVAYHYTGSYCRVIVTKSLDGGSTWSKPIGIAPIGDMHDQFFPWVNVSSSHGWVGVTWLDRRNDPYNVDYQAYAAISIDGGTTFPNFPLTTTPSNPNDDGFGGTFMGDYAGNAWDKKKSLRATWTDTTLGTGQDFVGGVRF